MIEKNLKILWCAFGRIIQFQVGRSTVEEAGNRTKKREKSVDT